MNITDYRRKLLHGINKRKFPSVSGINSEPFSVIIVTKRMGRQEFQRHYPVEFCILGFIHHTHAACPVIGPAPIFSMIL